MAAPRPSYDQALKRLLTQSHDGFLALIKPDAVWREELSPELPDTPRQADLIWAVEIEGERVALHIELQTKADLDIGERVAEYALRIWRRDHLPAHTIVVLLRPASTLPASPFIISYGGNERLRYAYDMIKMWELDPALVLATNEYHLWPLAGLMGIVTPESTIAVAEQIATAPLPRYEQGELTGLLALFASLRLNKTTIVQALRRSRMIDDILKESGLAEFFIEEGMQKGLEKGRLAATRQLARDAVAARFPAAAAALLDRIGIVTDSELLRRLILTPADFPDLAAVQTVVNAAPVEE